MSRVLQCDRCGNAYKYPKTKSDIRITEQVSEHGFKVRDLCPECQKRLKEWMSGVNATECNLFDQEETYENCTVQVLTNSVTGQCSVGWMRNRKDDDDGE